MKLTPEQEVLLARAGEKAKVYRDAKLTIKKWAEEEVRKRMSDFAASRDAAVIEAHLAGVPKRQINKLLGSANGALVNEIINGENAEIIRDSIVQRYTPTEDGGVLIRMAGDDWAKWVAANRDRFIQTSKHIGATEMVVHFDEHGPRHEFGQAVPYDRSNRITHPVWEFHLENGWDAAQAVAA